MNDGSHPQVPRCSAIADAGDGVDASAAAVRIASWIGARGTRVLLADARPGEKKSGVRSLSDLAPHLGSLDEGAIRGCLASADGPFGAVACGGKEEGAALRTVAEAYDLLLVAFCDRSLSRVEDIARAMPTLIVAQLIHNGGAAAAGRFIDRLLTREDAPRPAGFAIDGGDGATAARLSRRWGLPFWGFFGDAGHLAERLLERAVPIPHRETGTSEENSVLIRTQAPPPSPDEEEEPPAALAEEREDESVVADLLARLRQEKQFAEIRCPAGDSAAEARLRQEVAAAARRLLRIAPPEGRSAIDEDGIVARVIDEAVGFGPLEPLLADPQVTEVMVHGGGQIFVERGGRLERAAARFFSRGPLMAVIERMVARSGRRVDESSPMVDARLPDGSRLNVVLPPLAVDGPAVTVRKFVRRMRTLQDAVAAGMLPAGAAAFLAACVRGRASLLISGGTGAGKTTLLGMLAGAIDPGERVVTIEDAAELSLAAPHVVRLEARPPGIEGGGAVQIRDLVRNALRMRPDRIIVGECRGPEALDMLQAMNTGHEGSLATVHANSPRDALSRLETMVLMAGMELPLAAVREQIVRAVDAIVQVARGADGARRVVEIAEVAGLEGTTPCLQTLAAWGEGRGLIATGLMPRLAERLRARGIEPPSMSGEGG